MAYRSTARRRPNHSDIQRTIGDVWTYGSWDRRAYAYGRAGHCNQPTVVDHTWRWLANGVGIRAPRFQKLKKISSKSRVFAVFRCKRLFDGKEPAVRFLWTVRKGIHSVDQITRYIPPSTIVRHYCRKWICFDTCDSTLGGSTAEWFACWTQAQ